MEEKRFWNLVAQTGWSENWRKPNNVDICIRKLDGISNDELDDMHKMTAEMAGSVRERFEKFCLERSGGEFEYLIPDDWFENDVYISDDSFNDIFYHIVGLGEKKYLKAIEHPETIFDSFRTPNDVLKCENFGYVSMNVK